MICLTGKEKTCSELKKRLEFAKSLNALAEVRLDYLESNIEEIKTSLIGLKDRILITARPLRQGGEYRSSEAERLNLLLSLLPYCRYVDIEADIATDGIIELKKAAKKEDTKLILSWHDFDANSPIDRSLLEKAEAHEPDYLKIAKAIADPADLDRLFNLQKELKTRLIVIGMGDQGKLSRIFYTKFASAWTYLAIDESNKTASGQLSYNEYSELSTHPDHPFIALIGGDNISASPGPHVYNHWARQEKKNWRYYAFSTQKPSETVAFLQKLGALGISITMPHKEAFLEETSFDDSVKETAALNTIRFERKNSYATNTDVIGIYEPLKETIQLYALDIKSVLILGAGGAAKAAISAARRLNLNIKLSARNTKKLVPHSDVELIAWKNRNEQKADVLINATPLSGKTSPLSFSESKETYKIVFDLALSSFLTESKSQLLQDAKRAGSYTIDPLSMWVHQGAKQISWITGDPIRPKDLSEILRSIK